MKFIFPLDCLPENDTERYIFLHNYFCDQRGESWKENDYWVVQTYWPNTFEYFVDPLIEKGLALWNSAACIEEIHKEVNEQQDYQLSLNDSWTLYSWSKWLSKQVGLPDEIIILHVDYHSDLMSPRIGKSDKGDIDLLTGGSFDVTDPLSVKRAILSGAIGIGSFMMPLLHKINKVHLRHLCVSPSLLKKSQINCLKKGWEKDTLIAIEKTRPKVTFERRNENEFTKDDIHYKITNNVDEWIDNLPNAPILLHIDMDYFNCRYDGDSDWQKHPPRFDPEYTEMERQMNNVFMTIINSGMKNQVVDITVALSPGFFPAEFWENGIKKLTEFIQNMKR